MNQRPACSTWRPPVGPGAPLPSGDVAPADLQLARLAHLFRRVAPGTADRMLQDAVRRYRGGHDR